MNVKAILQQTACVCTNQNFLLQDTPKTVKPFISSFATNPAEFD